MWAYLRDIIQPATAFFMLQCLKGINQLFLENDLSFVLSCIYSLHPIRYIHDFDLF